MNRGEYYEYVDKWVSIGNSIHNKYANERGYVSINHKASRILYNILHLVAISHGYKSVGNWYSISVRKAWGVD